MSPENSPRRLNALNVILLALIVALLAWSIQSHIWQILFADISTNKTQTVSVILEDGTQLSLKENSAANINIDTTQRQLELIQGQFEIETSALCVRNLPIFITTPQGVFSPKDSSFDVDVSSNQTQLRVYKGHISLFIDSIDNKPHYIKANHGAILRAGHIEHFALTSPQ